MHTFWTQEPLKQDPTNTEEIRPMERELEVHQQEPIEAEEVRTLEKEAYTHFREGEEEIEEVGKRPKPRRKNSGN